MRLTYAQALYPEPVDWLHPGLIAKTTQTTLYGKPGIGKSLLALDIALSLIHI